MVGHRQTIQRQHPEHRRQSGKQDRHFKSHNDERRPGIERPPANVDGIADGIDPPLQSESASATEQPTNQANQSDSVLVKADGLR